MNNKGYLLNTKLVFLFVIILIISNFSYIATSEKHDLINNKGFNVVENQKNILIYVVSDRDDSQGWYTGPANFNPVVDMLENLGFSVDVEDEITKPEINFSYMKNYQQIWILEGDDDNIIEVNQSEADDLYSFYEQGGSVWISMELVYEEDYWIEDASVFANKFGVFYNGYVTGSHNGKYVNSSHPLFRDVDYIYFNNAVGYLTKTNSEVSMIWEYKPSYPGIAILDETVEGKGRVVIDSGWVMGHTYGINNGGQPWYDDMIFARNVAIWLYDTTSPSVQISNPEKGLYISNFLIRYFRLDFRRPLIIGKIKIEASAEDNQTEISKVEFYIDNICVNTDENSNYIWEWKRNNSLNNFLKHSYKIKVIAYDLAGNTDSDEIRVLRFL